MLEEGVLEAEEIVCLLPLAASFHRPAFSTTDTSLQPFDTKQKPLLTSAYKSRQLWSPTQTSVLSSPPPKPSAKNWIPRPTPPAPSTKRISNPPSQHLRHVERSQTAFRSSAQTKHKKT